MTLAMTSPVASSMTLPVTVPLSVPLLVPCGSRSVVLSALLSLPMRGDRP